MNTKSTEYETPAVTVDLIIFTVNKDTLKVLLVKRAGEPFDGSWSLPGGFLRFGESLDDAAQRVLVDKTGVREAYLEQLYTFGQPDRDPRSRVVTIAYFALIPWENLSKPTSEKVSGLDWFSVGAIPALAFDHNAILSSGVERLRAKAGYSNIVYGLLPERFRLSELQKIYEIILDEALDKRNFRKKMLATGLLQETGEKDMTGAHRPAMLFQFKKMEIAYLD